jgi:hypothetical protein
MESFFSQLPNDLFRYIFQYLTLENLMKIDQAFLINQELSLSYYNSLKGFVLTSSSAFPENQNEMNWILNHEILITNLRPGQRSVPNLEIFSTFRYSLKSIHYTCDKWDQCDGKLNDDLALIGHLPSLTSLYFEYGTNIDSDALLSFLMLHPQLETLGLHEMRNLSSKTFQIITEYCSNLCHLDLAYNRWVTDEIIILLTNGSLQKLKHLNLTETSVQQDTTICLLLDSLPNLSALYYSSYRYAVSTRLLILKQVFFRSILSDDQRSQTMALQCLDIHEDLLSLIFLSLPHLPLHRNIQ